VRTLGIFITALLLFLAGDISAQFLGQMSSADALDINAGVAGGYIVFADHATAVAGSVRYGFSDFVEGRGRLGYIDPDHGDGSIILGGDFKYQLWQYKQHDNPLDMALGGGVEYADFEGGSIVSFTGSVIGSIPFELKNKSVIEPYAQFHMRLQKVSGGDSELKAGVNLGAVFSIVNFTDFTAEVQIDDETAFMIGVDVLLF